LFQPIAIGPRTAATRTWIPAMVPWRATEDGFVTPDVIDWYRRFAEGRPGVLVVEATGIRDVPSGPLLRIGHDRFVDGLARLVDAVHQASRGETLFLRTGLRFKGKQGECFERNQAVIYRGPFREVLDDDNHRMERGKRFAVCDKTYNLYKKAPYSKCFEFVEPIVDVLLAEAKPFDCSRTSLRHPKETKGQEYKVTTEASSCCDGGSCS